MTTTSSAALTGAYQLDRAHTRLGFAASHTLGPKVRGTFEVFDGEVHLDLADPERSSAEVTIDVASVDTGSTRRDEHLRTCDFLDAGEHPRITFRSTAVHRLAHDRLRVTGELTIKGRTRSVTLDFTRTGAAEDTTGGCRVGFTGRGTLSRKKWGITWGGLLVSDGIALELAVAAVKDRRPSTARHLDAGGAG